MFSETAEVATNGATKYQKQEVYAFTFDNILRQADSLDYRDMSVEARLIERGYIPLPGGNDVLQTFEAGPHTGGNRFVIVIRLAHRTFVTETPRIDHYLAFMQKWGSAPSVFPYVALPQETPAPNNRTSFDLRRGY